MEVNSSVVLHVHLEGDGLVHDQFLPALVDTVHHAEVVVVLAVLGFEDELNILERRLRMSEENEELKVEGESMTRAV